MTSSKVYKDINGDIILIGDEIFVTKKHGNTAIIERGFVESLDHDKGITYGHTDKSQGWKKRVKISHLRCVINWKHRSEILQKAISNNDKAS